MLALLPACAILALSLFQLTDAVPFQGLDRRGVTQCRNSNTVFSKSTAGWTSDSPKGSAWKITSEGLQLNLRAPSRYQRKIDRETKLPYNTVAGDGATFNATGYMQYGKFSATLKSAQPGGAVTAVILIADGGDEIDFEIVGGEAHKAQSNYFWGKDIVYGVNGGVHTVSGAPIYSSFHTYTVDWSPSRIVWSIDGKVVRTKLKTATCKKGVCKYPTHAARVQIGVWDGSTEPGTAQWANGPIDWKKAKSVSTVIKSVQIQCGSKSKN